MVNNRWARLSQSEKAELLGIYISMGYNDLASIIAHYNSCGGKLKADGGPVTNTAQYKSDAYPYNPPVNVGAPIEVPLRYKPLPDYGDYVPQRTTGMLEDTPIELGLETPQRGYGVLVPDAPSALPTLDARQDAARRIMAVENSKNNVNGGYDAKTGRWYPHKSHEGGADTIAYGIKLSNGTPEAALALKQGYLTDEQAESAVDSLVQKYYDAAKRVYDGKYGAGEWDKLSDKSQSILVDYSYNPGLAKFPKLMEGFHSGNLDLIRKNYKRYVNGKELGRNKVLLEELDTLENEYPIFRAKGGTLFGNGGSTGNPNGIRPGESIAQWKERIKRQNATPEISGGKIAASVVYDSPSTKKGRYLKEKKLRAKVGMVASKSAENMINDFNDAINGVFISDPDIALSLREAAEYLPHPNAGEREAMYNSAKQQYLDSLHPGNDIFSQVYRYYRRHKKNRLTGPSFTGLGADIVSLDNNVIRLTPDSQQSNALVNEFVENKYPSVLTAKEYKENPDRIIGDIKQFPASNIHYYAGIEDGKFRIDELENFDDNTTVIPARNIKEGVPEIYGIRIDGLNNDGFNSNGTIRNTGYLSNINSRLWDNTMMQLESDAFDKWLEQKNIDVNEYEKAVDKNIQQYVDGNEVIPGKYNVPYYIYSGKKLSDMSLLEKAEIDWDRNYSDIMLDRMKPAGGWPEDYIVRAIDPLSLGAYDIDRYETDNLRNVRLRNAPLEQFKNDRYDFIAKTGSVFLGQDNNDPTKYGFVDKDGNLHSISEYHADVLDGKTVIGNPNGSIFIGRLQDISRPQLDSLNSYLAKNPSRILRTDLGSFNQYRLDDPSLESYLKQYYEHPKPNDPNVYVIGTTTPNTLWNGKANGGKIHIKPENRGKFTALKKRTGHSASWFKAHGTPAQKKMATFALNARKWKHEDGGPLREFDNISDIF